jgi:putative PIN family toxin of toxin-antitoxin system
VLAVLDPNVIISGLISPNGTPAAVLRALDRGEFELIASRALLDELRRALGYPKLQAHISREDAVDVARWVSDTATIMSSPTATTSVRSADPGDDYLIALASAHRAALVSGDKHLLSLSNEIPVFSPRDFLDLLAKA